MSNYSLFFLYIYKLYFSFDKYLMSYALLLISHRIECMREKIVHFLAKRITRSIGEYNERNRIIAEQLTRNSISEVGQ